MASKQENHSPIRNSSLFTKRVLKFLGRTGKRLKA